MRLAEATVEEALVAAQEEVVRSERQKTETARLAVEKAARTCEVGALDGMNDWPGTRYRQCFASVEKTSSEVTVPPGFLSQPGPTPCSTAVELKEMMLEKAR